MPTPPIDRAHEITAAWRRAYSRQNASDSTALPEIAARSDRAASDAAAAWLKWQVPPPAGLDAREMVWYELFERARVETLASRELPGIAQNLQTLEILAPGDVGAGHIYRLARTFFARRGWPAPVLPEVPPPPRPAAGVLASLRRRIAQPTRATGQSAPDWVTENAAKALLQEAATFLHDPERFALTLRPFVQWLAERLREPVPDTSSGVSAPQRRPAHQASGDTERDAGADESHGDSRLGRDAESTEPRQWSGYAIYSRQWDETRAAASFLADGGGAGTEILIQANREHIRRLAHRLQRRLLAARLRTWSFDQEDGYLDSRRLARLLAPVHHPAVFRQESASPIPEACVTLLVDQSVSMNSKRRQMAALAIDLAVHTLESCRVRSEVLGFTTRYGADSPIVEAWRRSGCPPAPGRLNAIRHIIYKSATQPWRRCRPSLSLLLRDGFGRENIDGEALDWAARRLAARPEPRKILIVLSDGSPYDAATRLAHDPLYLENHLRQIIAAVEASPIQLAAMGAGQDVGRFYKQALTLRRADAVPDILFEHLGDLLTRPG